jgi:hypothetical protein
MSGSVNPALSKNHEIPELSQVSVIRNRLHTLKDLGTDCSIQPAEQARVSALVKRSVRDSSVRHHEFNRCIGIYRRNKQLLIVLAPRFSWLIGSYVAYEVAGGLIKSRFRIQLALERKKCDANKTKLFSLDGTSGSFKAFRMMTQRSTTTGRETTKPSELRTLILDNIVDSAELAAKQLTNHQHVTTAVKRLPDGNFALALRPGVYNANNVNRFLVFIFDPRTSRLVNWFHYSVEEKSILMPILTGNLLPDRELPMSYAYIYTRSDKLKKDQLSGSQNLLVEAAMAYGALRWKTTLVLMGYKSDRNVLTKIHYFFTTNSNATVVFNTDSTGNRFESFTHLQGYLGPQSCFPTAEMRRNWLKRFYEPEVRRLEDD